MKNKVILLLIVFFSTVVNAQIVDIPDANFKNALVNFPVAELGNDLLEDVDTNDDGEIQVSEAYEVQKLFISNFFIDTIEGIQDFINLMELECTYNNISTVDVSQNLYLESLNFRNNQLNNLNVTQNLNLEYLDFAHNNLTSIDLSQNLNLITLFCDTNLLNNLDVSQNPYLELIQCKENLFTSLSFINNPNLIFLGCSFNNLTSLNVTNNINLETLQCFNNQLTSMDVSQNQNLKFLNCRYNQISIIDVSYNEQLQIIDCSQNEITSLDLSQNLNLFYIYCSENQLESLNISNDNNDSIIILDAVLNSALTCIQVDDVDYANSLVCGDNPNWCKDEAAIYSEDCSLSIDDNLQPQVMVYPNPTKDYLYIESSNTINSIKVFDVLGKLVFQENNQVNQIDISSLDNGLFFIKIETDQGVSTQKVLKQ